MNNPNVTLESLVPAGGSTRCARPSASYPLTLVRSGRAQRPPTRQPPPRPPSGPSPDCARLSQGCDTSSSTSPATTTIHLTWFLFFRWIGDNFSSPGRRTVCSSTYKFDGRFKETPQGAALPVMQLSHHEPDRLISPRLECRVTG